VIRGIVGGFSFRRGSSYPTLPTTVNADRDVFDQVATA
jgi:hypothetical protein